MNNFKRVSAVALAGAVLTMTCSTTYGMGFGRPVSRAVLGEPLRVSLPLRLEAGETIASECLSAQVSFGEDRLHHTQVHVALSGSEQAPNIVLRTHTVVTEPIVTFNVTAGCQAKITRQFVEFADPPAIDAVAVAAPSPIEAAKPVRVAAAEAQAKVAPNKSTPAVTRSKPTEVASSTAAAKPASARAAKPVAAPREETAATRPSLALASQAPHVEGGRLELDPVAADAAVKPDLRMSGDLAQIFSSDEVPSEEVRQRRAAAAAMWQAMNMTPEEIARDRQKLLAQSEMLDKLQDSASAPVAAAAGDGQQAQSQSNWLLYLVGGLTLAGLAVCAVLYGKLRRRQQEEAQWWAEQMEAQREPVDQPIATTSVSEPVKAAPVSEPVVPSVAVVPQVAAIAPTVASAAAQTNAWHSEPAVSAMSAARVGAAEQMREVSVEELIDLEQQAEFFVVLGQDEAAIDLLESHVHSVAASPLPYLKLLEIYQRLGKRDEYERIQQEFNQRFNGHAPAWDADLQHGHALSEYPGVVERLQALWQTPERAMEVLEKSITRPEPDADTFELPAYRELLFLYAVARDLSERNDGDRARVDLLPADPGVLIKPVSMALDDSGPEVAPLMATRPVKAIPAAQPSFSLDLQLDDLELAPREPSTRDTGPDSEHIDLSELTATESLQEPDYKP